MNKQAGKGRQGPLRAALYLRQSLDATGEGLAIARQGRECETLARSRGWEVVAMFEDNDISATSRKPRPRFRAMVEAAQRDEFDVIVAYHLDRLTRTLRDFLPLQALADDHGVKVCTVSGDLDMTTDMGSTVAGLLTVVANGEVKRKGKRQELAARQRAEMGKPAPGPRPFGYEDDKVRLRRSEATAVKRAYRSLLAGSSASSIARDLNERGFATTFGKPWAHMSVKQVLTNPRYAGLRAHRGEVVGPAIWTGIVDEQTWRSAVSILTDASRRTNHRPGNERTRLLTGIARCGVCDDDTTVLGGSRGAGAPTYRCRSSKHLERRAEAIEEVIHQRVLDRLSAPDAADLLVDRGAPEFDALQAEALTISDRKKAIMAEFVTDDTRPPTWLRETMAALDARQAEVESRMVHTSRAAVFADLVRAVDTGKAWKALSLERQRAVVAALFTVTLHRGQSGGNTRNGRMPFDLRTITVTERPL